MKTGDYLENNFSLWLFMATGLQMLLSVRCALTVLSGLMQFNIQTPFSSLCSDVGLYRGSSACSLSCVNIYLRVHPLQAATLWGLFKKNFNRIRFYYFSFKLLGVRPAVPYV